MWLVSQFGARVALCTLRQESGQVPRQFGQLKRLLWGGVGGPVQIQKLTLAGYHDPKQIGSLAKINGSWTHDSDSISLYGGDQANDFKYYKRNRKTRSKNRRAQPMFGIGTSLISTDTYMYSHRPALVQARGPHGWIRTPNTCAFCCVYLQSSAFP